MTTTPSYPTVRLFELNVAAASIPQMAQLCISLVRNSAESPDSRRPALVFSLNPEKVMRAAQDPAAHELLCKATFLIPDGVGVCLASRVLTGKKLSRLPGSDLMPAICTAAQSEGLSVYLYGASARSNTDAVDNMRKQWPNLLIIGSCDGFQLPGSASDDPLAVTVANEIRRLKPDIVFVGLGSPRQEIWMAEVGNVLPVGLIQGVGGTIDVLSGTARRAPQQWQKLGLEWLFRLLQDPRRWRRQLALVKFTLFVLRSKMTSHRPVRPA